MLIIYVHQYKRPSLRGMFERVVVEGCTRDYFLRKCEHANVLANANDWVKKRHCRRLPILKKKNQFRHLIESDP